MLIEGVTAQKTFNLASDVVSVTDLAYFMNLASVLANSKLETIREYPFAKLFCNELNNESSDMTTTYYLHATQKYFALYPRQYGDC